MLALYFGNGLNHGLFFGSPIETAHDYAFKVWHISA